MNLDIFKKLVEDLGPTLEHDEDWMPTLFMQDALSPENQSGKRVIIIAGLCMDLNTQEQKDKVAEAIKAIIITSDPSSACFIVTAWTTRHEGDMSKIDSGILRVSESPHKEEAVVCVCVGGRGELDGETIMIGRIERSSGSPKIKSWDIMSGEEGVEFGGRFYDALQEAFTTITENKT